MGKRRKRGGGRGEELRGSMERAILACEERQEKNRSYLWAKERREEEEGKGTRRGGGGLLLTHDQ